MGIKSYGAVAVLLLIMGMYATIKTLQTDVAQKETENVTLGAAVEKQNDSIDKLALAGETLAATASTEAARALIEGATREAAIQRQGTGPEEMNRWLQKNFP